MRTFLRAALVAALATTPPAHAATVAAADVPPRDAPQTRIAEVDASPRVPAPADPRTPPPGSSLDLGDQVIRKAIADSRDPSDPVPSAGRAAFGGTAPTGAERLDRRFREAEIPTCMTADAFRFDPPTMGPIGLGGYLALPFWLHAIATGRCRH